MATSQSTLRAIRVEKNKYSSELELAERDKLQIIKTDGREPSKRIPSVLETRRHVSVGDAYSYETGSIGAHLRTTSVKLVYQNAKNDVRLSLCTKMAGSQYSFNTACENNRKT